MLTRLEAIQDIRLGRGIQLSFVGQVMPDGSSHRFNVILRRDRKGGCNALIDCQVMKKTYKVQLTAQQVLSYIKLHYARSPFSDLKGAMS